MTESATGVVGADWASVRMGTKLGGAETSPSAAVAQPATRAHPAPAAPQQSAASPPTTTKSRQNRNTPETSLRVVTNVVHSDSSMPAETGPSSTSLIGTETRATAQLGCRANRAESDEVADHTGRAFVVHVDNGAIDALPHQHAAAAGTVASPRIFRAGRFRRADLGCCPVCNLSDRNVQIRNKGTSIQRRSRSLCAPSSASCTPLAPSSSV
jgi:hypothetical protein